MKGLRNKRVFLTGASAGIGRATAQRLWSEGCHLHLVDRDGDGLDRLRIELGPRDGQELVTEDFDLVDGTTLHAALDAAGEAGLDALVLNAAVVTPAASVHETAEADLDRLEAVNQRATFRALKWAFPHLRRSRGCVVAMTSMAGVTGQANHALYAASKGWLNALVKATAVDWGPMGIRINAIAPCGVMTPAMQTWIDAQADPSAMTTNLELQHALGRPAEPEEIAGAAAFLCSEDASFVTGAILPVSGGSECGYRA